MYGGGGKVKVENPTIGIYKKKNQVRDNETRYQD